MDIKTNEHGQLIKVKDNSFVAHASGWGLNNLDLYFVPEKELTQSVTMVNFSVTRADGFTILNLRGEYTTGNIDTEYGAEGCYRYVITETDGVLGVPGQLQVSAQLLHINEDGSKEIIAVVQTTATVYKNIGVEDGEGYDAVAAVMDEMYIKIQQMSNKLLALEGDLVNAESAVTAIVEGAQAQIDNKIEEIQGELQTAESNASAVTIKVNAADNKIYYALQNLDSAASTALASINSATNTAVTGTIPNAVSHAINSQITAAEEEIDGLVAIAQAAMDAKIATVPSFRVEGETFYIDDVEEVS